MKNKTEFSKAVSLTKKNESLTLYNSAQQRVDPGKTKVTLADHGALKMNFVTMVHWQRLL